MEISFEPITNNNISEALEIYNWYVLNSTATFHIEAIEADELKKMISIGHPKYQSFVVIEADKIIGFCYLSQFRYKEAYDGTAEITLYFHQNATKKGLGKHVLLFLEKLAKQHQIVNLIGVITEENNNSIKLFEKCGYFKAAHLKKVGVKFNKALDVTWYQKEI